MKNNKQKANKSEMNSGDMSYFINDYLKLILSGTKLFPIQKNNIKNLLLTADGRRSFINCIRDNKVKQFC